MSFQSKTYPEKKSFFSSSSFYSPNFREGRGAVKGGEERRTLEDGNLEITRPTEEREEENRKVGY